MAVKKLCRRQSYEPIIRDTTMSDFSKVAFIICAFVTMREFRPVEPFFTSYLTSPPLNFTTEQVNEKIYPIGMIIVTLWSFFIPSVDHSIYFHKVEKKIIQINGNKDDPEDGKIEEKIITVVKSQKLSSVGKRLFQDFKMAYTNTYVLKWSLWWALALCGFFFVNTYSQVLWQITAEEHGGEKYLMNGAIDSIYTISSALAACLIAQLKIDWKTHGDWILSLVSFSLSFLVLFQYSCRSLWLIYLGYVTFGIIFQTMLTIAQSEVAQHIERDSYALIFGFNLFVALGLGSFITYTVIEGNLVYFATREQFLFYGAYFATLTVVFVIVAAVSSIRKCFTSIEL